MPQAHRFRRVRHSRGRQETGSSSSASVITSKPAIYDHFKTGQRSRTQDMKLFYRAGGSSGKLFLIFLTHHAPSRPAGGRKCFGVVAFLSRFFFPEPVNGFDCWVFSSSRVQSCEPRPVKTVQRFHLETKPAPRPARPKAAAAYNRKSNATQAAVSTGVLTI